VGEDLLKDKTFGRRKPVDAATGTICVRRTGLRCSSRTLLLLALTGGCLFASSCISTTIAVAPSGAAKESSGPAESSLQITDPATNEEIEGYASAASLNRGEDIKLYVNTKEPSYAIEVLRVGWYGGRGMKRMTSAIVRRGVAQAPPELDFASGLIECDWKDPYILHVPNTPDPEDWPSGIYLAKLTAGSSGKQGYIVFVVRDDQRSSDLLFQSSVTTYQAYNDWGGRSLYSKPRATKVSFNRPYAKVHGTGLLLLWELSLVRFLEKEGYDVTYTTDVDTHERGNLLSLHKAFLSTGHDEYWSWQMRDNVEAARDNGVNLAFFGANVGYWQIRFEPSPITGAPDRTIVCYKNQSSDPMSHSDDPSVRRLTTVKFRSHPVDRPEDALVGVMYESDPVQGDIVVSDASSWVFEGTGLKNGDHLPGLLGYEVDRSSEHTPLGAQRIAHSPYAFRGNTRYADMIVYTAPSGSTVVATGTMQWSWGLVDPEIPGKQYENPAVQVATRNIFRRFGARPGSSMIGSMQGSPRNESDVQDAKK
jgi:hypothetical protein